MCVKAEVELIIAIAIADVAIYSTVKVTFIISFNRYIHIAWTMKVHVWLIWLKF